MAKNRIQLTKIRIVIGQSVLMKRIKWMKVRIKGVIENKRTLLKQIQVKYHKNSP